jgi:hypothetical protein
MIKNYRNINLTLICALLGLLLSPAAFAEESTDLFENLVAIDDPRVAMAYIDPEADFGVFDKVMILDTFVAFRSGWQRDQRRGTRGIGVTARDMDRIKDRVSELFNSVLIEQLEADDGFEIVDQAGDDVLLVRAAIIDLDVTAPDTMTAGRSATFTASSGAATLYIELFDSVSGQIIGRAADRQTTRNSASRLQWSNRASNTNDARRVFRSWAGKLREFLDSHYSAGTDSE